MAPFKYVEAGGISYEFLKTFTIESTDNDFGSDSKKFLQLEHLPKGGKATEFTHNLTGPATKPEIKAITLILPKEEIYFKDFNVRVKT